MPFSFLLEFKHTLISKGRQHTDSFKDTASTTLNYIKYLFQPLLLRIHRMPPVTNCLLRSFHYFPCGTHNVPILQRNNCIFIECA